MAKLYIWDPTKNAKLIEQRGISFDDIVKALSEGKLLGSTPHHIT